MESNQRFALNEEQAQLAITAITHLNAMRQLSIMQKEAREGMQRALDACYASTKNLSTQQDHVDHTNLRSKIVGAKSSVARIMEEERKWHFREFLRNIEEIHPGESLYPAPDRDNATLLEMIESYLPDFSGNIAHAAELDEWIVKAQAK